VKYLDQQAILELYLEVMRASGGLPGIRDAGALESAIAQPHASFGGEELYPTLVDKAAALAFSMIKNHPFVDGNKRIAFASMDAFLRLNGYKTAGSDDQVAETFLSLAAGTLNRDNFTNWLREHLTPRAS
jgi:death-on-curing protein